MLNYVEIYWNLHKKCFSYRPPGGLVKHADRLAVRNPKFVSQPAGRNKVRETGRKNVHAYVRGDRISVRVRPDVDSLVRVRYDPYTMDTWQTEEGREIHQAKYAYLADGKVWVVL